MLKQNIKILCNKWSNVQSKLSCHVIVLGVRLDSDQIYDHNHQIIHSFFVRFTGLHVQQRLSGCELLDHDQPGPMFVHDAFNGESGDHLSANKDQYSFRSQWHWPAMWDILVADQVKWLHKSLYHPICLRTLRTYLHRHKNHLLRKGRPTTFTEPLHVPLLPGWILLSLWDAQYHSKEKNDSYIILHVDLPWK